jgi:hypothetical protein
LISALTSKTINKLLILCIFAAPFMYGLLYKGQFYTFLITILVLFFLNSLWIKEFCVDMKIFVLLLAQIIASFITIFSGINKQEALYNIFLTVLPLLIFLLALNATAIEEPVLGNKKNAFSKSIRQSPILNQTFDSKLLYPHKLYLAFFLSGIFISLINFGIMVRYYSDTNKMVRLEGIIPYANTLALYLFICSLIGMYFSHNTSYGLLTRALIKYGICLNIIALIFTYSRTMWVFSFVIYSLYLVFQRRMRYVLNFCSVSALSLFSCLIISFTKWSIIGLFSILILCLFFIFLYEYLSKHGVFTIHLKHISPKNKIMLTSLSSLGFLALIVLLLFFKHTGFYTRLLTINLGASELQERFAYYSDAIKILKDFPFLGVGPGGWSSAQFQYQTSLYATKYVHSSVFQAALNYGIVGLILFVAQISIFISYSLKAFRRASDSSVRGIIVLSSMCNLAIILHSLTDIDFEFPIISILFWINMVVLSTFSVNYKVYKPKSRSRNLLISTATLFVLLFLLPSVLSLALYTSGVQSFNKKAFSAAENYFNQASFFNPLASDVYYTHAELLKREYSIEHKNYLKVNCIGFYNTAQYYDPKNPRFISGKISIFNMSQDFKNSISGYRELIKLQPLVIGYYELLAQTINNEAENAYYKDKTKESVKYFSQVPKIEQEIQKASMKVSGFAFRLKHGINLKTTPKLAYNIGKALYYLGEYGRAENYFRTASTNSSLAFSVKEFRNSFIIKKKE